jgi:excisionase family DNA binding protein
MLKRLLNAPPVFLDALNRAIPASSQELNPTVSDLVMQDPKTPARPTLHTIEEVAKELRVSTKTVRRRIRDGIIRTVPIGGRLVRISSDELRRLLSGPGLEP